jgi:hypothetical protein
MMILAFVVIGLEIIAIIVYVLLSSEWLAKFFYDKIENATVHVWNGKGYQPVKATLIDTTIIYTYRYKIYGTYHHVGVPDSYPVQYEKRRRMIYAQIGTVIPIALPGKEAIKYCESEIASNMAIESVKAAFMAIKKKGFQLSLTMILIGVLVIAAIGGGIWYYTSHNKSVPKSSPAVITTQRVQ